MLFFVSDWLTDDKNIEEACHIDTLLLSVGMKK